MVRRIGVVGFVNLGKYLVAKILDTPELELAFVWNRSLEAILNIDKTFILQNLKDFASKNPELIVEVAHPSISKEFGSEFLQVCDYMIGSPTALADPAVEKSLRDSTICHGAYIPTGAFWGGEDIKRMADRGTLKGLKVTMTKPPESFKLESPLKEKNDKVKDVAVQLYIGSVRDLCPLAPKNVNTMAAACIAAHNIGFDKVQGCIVADPKLLNWHLVEIEVTGPTNPITGDSFSVKTTRRNPAQVGKVTGSATYGSFYSSMIAAKGKGSGFHLC